MSAGAFDADGTLQAEVGSELSIELPALSSAGYRWFPIFDERALGLDDPVFTGSKSGRPGSGGFIIQVHVLVAGRHQLVLELRRPWEKEAADRRTVTIVAR